MKFAKWEHDEFDQKVPIEFKPVFNGMNWYLLEQWLMRLERLMRELGKFDGPGYDLLDPEGVQRAVILSVREHIAKCKPYAVCPMCYPRRDSSCICKGRRWISQAEATKHHEKIRERAASHGWPLRIRHRRKRTRKRRSGTRPKNKPQVQTPQDGLEAHDAGRGSDVLRETVARREDADTPRTTETPPGVHGDVERDGLE